VPYPAIWPNCCIRCTSQKGPQWDTLAERPGLGRVYLCLMCIEEAARVAGYIEGPELDRLHDAVVVIADLERLNDEQQQRLVADEILAMRQAERITELESELDEAQGRVAVLERGNRETQEMLASVGAKVQESDQLAIAPGQDADDPANEVPHFEDEHPED